MLPLLERLPRYVENGLYSKVDELAGNILGSGEEALISSLPLQLSNVRTAKSSALLLDERQDKKEAVAALSQLGSSSGLVYLLSGEDNEAAKDNKGMRRAAAEALGRLGDSSTMPALVNLFSDADNEDVRKAAAEALGKLGDRSVVPVLINHLSDEHDKDVLKAIAEAFGRLGDRSATSALLMLKDKDTPVRMAATKVLNKWENNFELFNLLTNEDAKIQVAAAEELGSQGDSSAVPALIRLFSNENEDTPVRQAAARTLGKLDSGQAVPFLIKLISNENEETAIRQAAARLLGKLGSGQAVPSLIKLISNENEETAIRQAAARLLGKLGSSLAVPPLIKLIKSEKDRNIWRDAVNALGKLSDNSATPALLDLFYNTNVELQLRLTAAKALARLGDISALVELLEDEKSIREDVVVALARLGGSSAVPTLIELVSGEPGHVRLRVVEAFLEMGDVSGLIKLTEDDFDRVQANAAQALGKMGDKKAVPTLLKLLNEDESDYGRARENAAEALGRLGEISSLLNIINGNYSERQLHAVLGVLNELIDESVVPMPMLIELLKHRSESVRIYAARALGSLGNRTAVPALLELLAKEERTEYDFDRAEVLKTLGKLDDRLAGPPLTELLAYESEEMKRYIAVVLKKLRYTSGLIKLLSGESPELRFFAAKALSEQGDSSAMPTLLEVFSDDSANAEDLWSAQESLVRLGDSSAVPRLLEFLAEGEREDRRRAAAMALGMLGDMSAVPLLSKYIEDDSENMRDAVVKALGRLGVRMLLTDKSSYVRRRAARALRGKGADVKRSAVQGLDRLKALRKIILDSQGKLTTRLASLDSLGATGRPDCAKEIYELLANHMEKDQDDSLRYHSFMWLGRMAYSPARDYMEDELKKLAQEKATWRKERDSKQQEAASNELEEKHDKSWHKEYWEYMLGNSLARIAPEERGIDLLNHPLYQVRQGTIRALASRIADGTDGAELIGKIIQAHQNFDPDDLPSPFPYAAFQAIDLALWNLEYTGKPEDITMLKDICDKLKPCRIPGQEGAIKERLQWTIDRLKSRLKQNDSNKNQYDLS
ncbi:MAG: HEAT repeat domain-containing protein [Candidatus Electrothrix sp. GM3_4]|nr:HEAT repeat domain-containing protein [Candidatus Electrothrix sp. GM3_4]